MIQKEEETMAKIIVIDDEEGMRYVLSNILKKAGYDVVTAVDGKNALEVLSAHRPDMAFLDIHLPDMDGTQVLREIKKIKDMPVVMCSGFGDVDFAVDTMKHGALDYVSKPFKNQDVLDAAKKGMDYVKEQSEKKKEQETVVHKVPEETVVSVSKPKKQSKLPIIAIVAILAVLTAVGGLFFLKPEKEASQQMYAITYSNPTSVAYDGESLWISDWFGETVYKHNLDEELSIARYFSLIDMHPAAIAWGVDSIWTVDSWATEINQHDLDDSLSVRTTYSYPGTNPAGLFYDGTVLWVCDSEENMIYKFMPTAEELQIIKMYKSPGPNPVGVFWDRKNIWTVDADLRRVYKHNMDAKLTVVETYKLPQEIAQGSKISGAGWDETNIWIVADKKAEVFSVNINSLEKQ
jgi:FixJ family two-component response regulator/outer membrane lipoprotein-sorting protein